MGLLARQANLSPSSISPLTQRMPPKSLPFLQALGTSWHSTPECAPVRHVGPLPVQAGPLLQLIYGQGLCWRVPESVPDATTSDCALLHVSLPLTGAVISKPAATLHTPWPQPALHSATAPPPISRWVPASQAPQLPALRWLPAQHTLGCSQNEPSTGYLHPKAQALHPPGSKEHCLLGAQLSRVSDAHTHMCTGAEPHWRARPFWEEAVSPLGPG